MKLLHEYFVTSLERMGIAGLPGDLSGPGRFRFSVGGEEKIFLGDHRRPNGAYIENAADRAVALYEALPGPPDILRIDDCQDLPFLPSPEERLGASCYWTLPKEPPWLRKLFREIIRSELDPAGIEGLTGNVYFLDTFRDVLFHLYDDRGCDIVAATPETLASLRDSCRDWIVETD